MLTPPERIQLIRETARRLGQESWSLIDLTLKQFKVPQVIDWSGSDRGEYVLRVLSDSPEETLVPLAQYLGYEHESPRPQVQPTFWRLGCFRLFLTHIAKHKQEAGALRTALYRYNVSGFVAHNDIEPTREWQDEIHSALATADALAALLHPGFHSSNWTDQELGVGMGRDLLIIAIQHGEDPYGFIARFQALQGVGKTAEAQAALVFDVLRKHKQTRRRMAEALVSRFEEVSTYAGAKEGIELLEQAEYWAPSLSKRVTQAVQSNTQIAEAYGVPDRVRTLVAGWTAKGV